ncbi:hypothetical protein SAMN02910413_0348 [Pseudobutyrivibrio sp. C4]|uniref:hypothetical protein n=1 Tax=Pseudobutyrivibrio sp. C4 TaxID=1520803 RepID=UPI0008CBE071|nr:hypothetical protein [Pseudobutyrivibrio sp. C4]SES66264.1 hypothetical protein SAMN02910413_0348 [Pseudobutyrivibrio sp. C4]
MKKVLSCFLWVFYVAIILYVLFAVLNIDTLENFVSALVFESIGFISLAYFIFCNMFSKPIKVGYFVPLLMATIIYTIVLDVVNIACVATVGSVFFTLINLVLLFVYCLVSIPMYLMGRR